MIFFYSVLFRFSRCFVERSFVVSARAMKTSPMPTATLTRTSQCPTAPIAAADPRRNPKVQRKRRKVRKMEAPKACVMGTVFFCLFVCFDQTEMLSEAAPASHNQDRVPGCRLMSVLNFPLLMVPQWRLRTATAMRRTTRITARCASKAARSSCATPVPELITWCVWTPTWRKHPRASGAARTV